MDTYKKLFSHLQEVPTPEGLAHAIVARAAFERERAVRRRRAVYGGVSLFSFVAAVPTLSMLMQDLVASGFIQYFTLLLSDSSLVLQYGKTFAFSLAETVPVVSASLLLALASLFVWSLAQTLRYSSNKPAWI